MPYYQAIDGQLYFFDYVPEPQNIRADLVAITDEAAEAILSEPLPVEVPTVLTRRQAKLALVLAGVYPNVSGAIAAIADETERLLVQVAWEDSETFERDNATLLMLANALGLTSSQIDDMFITGATL